MADPDEINRGRIEPLEPEIVLIPAGYFLMGSDPRKDKDARRWEQPQHTLYLPDYYLGKTPVTNFQYAAFVQAAGYNPPGHWKDGRLPESKEEHPVVCVSWRDALAYCGWLSKVTGRAYGLPSEAEWEKGARGTDGRIYPWGDGWDGRWCNSSEVFSEDTLPVGVYPAGASPYDLLDMAGNVWEWTRSLYRGYPYDPTDGRESLQVEGNRVLRGGAFSSDCALVRCACRDWLIPSVGQGCSIGFRVFLCPG